MHMYSFYYSCYGLNLRFYCLNHQCTNAEELMLIHPLHLLYHVWANNHLDSYKPHFAKPSWCCVGSQVYKLTLSCLDVTQIVL